MTRKKETTMGACGFFGTPHMHPHMHPHILLQVSKDIPASGVLTVITDEKGPVPTLVAAATEKL